MMREKNLETVLSIYGVRGSIAAPKAEFMGFGGNTSSYALRTPNNTLIFLDAGTGIRYAADELKEVADQVILAISHTHADHTMGLGMSALPWFCFNPHYKDKKVKLLGPKGTEAGLRQYYDGKKTWPVHFSNSPNEKPNMPGIDISGIEELIDKDKTHQVDDSTKFKIMKGNHPVEGGVILYRFEIQEVEGGPKSIVYDTDNEFDFIGVNKPNKNAEQFKQKYIDFVKDSDILIADAQYTKEEYIDKIPKDVRGFGHAYVEQVIDLAEQANVKYLIITHHSPNKNDVQLAKIEHKAKNYASKKGYKLQIDFAKENSQYKLRSEISGGKSIKKTHCGVI